MKLDVEWEACSIAPVRNPELEQDMRRRMGIVPGFTGYFAQCPWVPRGIAGADFFAARLVHAPLELAQKINLVVSQDNSCRYCFSAHRMILRMMGLPEKQIQRLEQDLLTADLKPGERAVLQFARRLSRSNPLLVPRDLEPLQAAGYSDDAIRELALLATFAGMTNHLFTLAALPPERFERLADGLVMQLLLPVVGRFLQRRWGGSKADHFAPEVGEEPFAPLIVAFDGLPLGRSLWRMQQEAWTSDILPRRSKALVFAVVARALACQESEREAARLCREEGLPGDQLDGVLAHLGSPVLDQVEALIVPFARETVWYRPAPIQRRVNALQEHLTLPQLLELIGITAMANMVCRLCVIAATAR